MRRVSSSSVVVSFSLCSAAVLTSSSRSPCSIDAITAHGSYWADHRFSTFCLTQLFADPTKLEENAREQIGIEEEDDESAHEA